MGVVTSPPPPLHHQQECNTDIMLDIIVCQFKTEF